jgi:formylglycine-generating enzyme required for sulfatase activity
MRLPRYNSWRREIRVVANEPQIVPQATLSPEDGKFSLTTSPSDASVIVNGEFVGRTPHELALQPDVEHSVTIQKPGYETQLLTRRFDPGERESLALTLNPRIGVIEVTSTPAGAEIFVNGEAAGTTPATFEFIAVDQTITLRLDGYAEEERVITPRPGYPQSLPFELVALNQATGGGYAGVITTGFGTRLRLIPAGRFTMGSSRSEEGRRLNEYLHDVEITRAFYLAETEMTNAEYRRCVPDHDSGSFEGHSLNEDDQPVVNVAVQEIFACLNRLSIQEGLQPVYQEENGVLAAVRPLRNGYRLPTEAEFAWALRAAGRGAVEPLRYSWGEEPPPPDRFDNLADLSASDIVSPAMITYRDGAAVSAPVGSFTANAVGLYDMGGNVSEWVQDFYDATTVPDSELQVDPLGPVTGQLNVVRGPSWMSATVRQLRLSFRDFEDSGRVDLGFRIARNIE